MQPTNVPRWIRVATPDGPLRALAFVARPRRRRLCRPPTARPSWPQIIARAAGHWGSAAQYLQRTVDGLEQHGIRDRNLWTLQKLVADEIRRTHPGP